MEIPKWAEKVAFIKCPVCGENAVIELKHEEKLQSLQQKNEILFVLCANCVKCGTGIAIRGKKKHILKIIIE